MDKSLEFHRKHVERRGAEQAKMVEQLSVGGEWTDGSASAKTFGVTNPANGDTPAILPDAGREEQISSPKSGST